MIIVTIKKEIKHFNMKKIILIFGMILGIVASKAQESDSTSRKAKDTDSTIVKHESENQAVVADSNDHKVLGDKPKVYKNGDTTRIRLGNKGITIVKKDGKTNVQIDELKKRKKDNEDQEEDSNNNANTYNDFPKFRPFHEKDHWTKFNPHWGGLELTLNNFMTKDFSMNLPKESQFMELNAGKSIGVDLNILEYAIPFTSEQGIATGLGFEFNSYDFDSDTNNIMKQNGTIVPKVKDKNAGNYSKNKLKDTYLTIPVLYEIQFPLGNRRRPFYIAAGVIGGLKLGSTTKAYYQLNGNDVKDVVRGDFYMSSLRYGFQARIGFRKIHLVATYYDSPLFQNNKGPELHPFDIGIMLVNW
jgi:hypothetical protein